MTGSRINTHPAALGPYLKIGVLFLLTSGFLFFKTKPVHAEFPNDKPINIYVPFGRGGPTDTVVRIVTKKAEEALGQKINVIPAKPGETPQGVVLKVAALKPDGYNLTVGNLGTHGAGPALEGASLRYDPVENFTPVAMIGVAPMIIAVRKDFPGDNFSETIREIRENPGSFAVGHGGRNSTSFLAALYFTSLLKLKMNFIGYAGSAPALQDLAYGYIDMMIDQSVSAASFVNGNLARALAVTSNPDKSNESVLSRTPAMREIGLPEYNITGWNMLFAPKGVDDKVLTKLNAAFRSALKNKIIRAQALDTHIYHIKEKDNFPEQLRNFVKMETIRWKKIVNLSTLSNSSVNPESSNEFEKKGF